MQSGVIALTLAVGSGVVVAFALLGGTLVGEPATKLPTVAIPDGASRESTGMNYTPEVIIVFMGLNNTVRWVNHDSFPHSIASDSLDFSTSTKGVNPALIMPSESFEYTFTKPGMHHYHGEPGPWLRGLVLVLPEIREEPHVEISVLGLQESYIAGDKVEFTVLVAGYETDCFNLTIQLEGGDEPRDTYSTGLVTDCEITAPFRDIERELPLDLTGKPFSFKIDRPGTYLLKASYEASVTGTSGTAEKEIVVLTR